MTNPAARDPGFRRKLTVVAVACATELVAVLAIGVVWGAAEPVATFQGLPVPYPVDAADIRSTESVIMDGTAYFMSMASEGDVWVTAVGLETGALTWRSGEPMRFESGTHVRPELDPGTDAVYVSAGRGVYLVDAATGTPRLMDSENGDEHRMVAGVPVRTTDWGEEIAVLDATGEPLWTAEAGDGRTADIEEIVPVTASEGTAEQILTVDVHNDVKVYDLATGTVLHEKRELRSPGTRLGRPVAHDGVVYVHDTVGGHVAGYDIAGGFAEIGRWEHEGGRGRMWMCANTKLCLQGPDEVRRDLVIGTRPDHEVLWRSPAGAPVTPYSEMSYAGGRLAVSYLENGTGNATTVLYPPADLTEGVTVPGLYTAAGLTIFAHVTLGVAGTGDEGSFVVSVLDADTGTVTGHRTYPGTEGCVAGEEHLACASGAGYHVWPLE